MHKSECWMDADMALPITMVAVNRLTNLNITHQHVNFHLGFSICNMGSHGRSKRPTSKHHYLKSQKPNTKEA